MREIELQEGIKLKIDAEDYKKMIKWNWYLKQPRRNDRKTKTATPKVHAEEGTKTIEFAQTLLEYNNEQFFVAYKNKDRLDFRKENLQLIPIKYLYHHTSCRLNSTSKYRGVYYDKRRKKYISTITVEKKKIYIGSYEKENEAAEMYNKKAIELFGEYACLNKLTESNYIQIIDRKFEKTKKEKVKKQTKLKENKLKEIAEQNGISERTIKSRLKKMSLEEALKMGKTKEKTKSPNGISFTKLAEEYGVNRQTLSKYIKNGFSIKDAVQTIYSEKNKRKTPIA